MQHPRQDPLSRPATPAGASSTRTPSTASCDITVAIDQGTYSGTRRQASAIPRTPQRAGSSSSTPHLRLDAALPAEPEPFTAAAPGPVRTARDPSSHNLAASLGDFPRTLAESRSSRSGTRRPASATSRTLQSAGSSACAPRPRLGTRLPTEPDASTPLQRPGLLTTDKLTATVA